MEKREKSLAYGFAIFQQAKKWPCIFKLQQRIRNTDCMWPVKPKNGLFRKFLSASDLAYVKLEFRRRKQDYGRRNILKDSG